MPSIHDQPPWEVDGPERAEVSAESSGQGWSLSSSPIWPNPIICRKEIFINHLISVPCGWYEVLERDWETCQVWISAGVHNKIAWQSWETTHSFKILCNVTFEAKAYFFDQSATQYFWTIFLNETGNFRFLTLFWNDQLVN